MIQWYSHRLTRTFLSIHISYIFEALQFFRCRKLLTAFKEVEIISYERISLWL